MHKENSEPIWKREFPNPHLVGLLMGIFALTAPYGFSYPFPEVYIQATIWVLIVSPTLWRFEVVTYLDTLQVPLGTLFYFILILLYLFGIRILFAYQTTRYFQGKTTRKRLITLGVLAEFPLAFFVLSDILRVVIMTAMRAKTSISFIPPIPIPCMLALSMLLLRYFPRPGESDWDLKKETKKWWIETGLDSTKT